MLPDMVNSLDFVKFWNDGDVAKWRDYLVQYKKDPSSLNTIGDGIYKDTDGNIKDTVILNNTDEKVSGNISAEFYGGDERCLLIGFSTHDIKGLELSEEEQNLRIKLEDEVFKNKKGFVDVNVSAILDKSQIGSGNITLEPVTPE